MSAKSRRARIAVPPQPSFLEPAVAFALSFAARFERSAEEQSRLGNALSAVLGMVIENTARGKPDEDVAVEVWESEGLLTVEILNRGTPILLNGGRHSGINAAYFSKFQEAARQVSEMAIENSWRKGQTVSLKVRLGPGAAAHSLASSQPEVAAIPEDEHITIRRLAPGEEDALSRLFFLVYGYDYVNEVVYYPEKLRALVEAGDLLSIVAARPNGRLVGHVGVLRKRKTPSVYEAAMGVVDPMVKSRGLFGRLFEKTMATVRETPMQYCLFDFVTNHDYSQRHIAKYGSKEMALFVGCQSRETQARLERIGLGPDPEGMDRYSILVGVIPQTAHPFGKDIVLPENIGGPFGFLLKPLGLSWSPAPRFQTLPAQGNYAASYQPAQSAVVFDLAKPGLDAVERLLEEWRQLLREGFQYAAVEVPLSAPGVGNLYDLLSSNGFFAAGFIPYHYSDRLGFRFQSLGPTEVAFDKIKAATEPGRRLLKLVREDHEASRLI